MPDDVEITVYPGKRAAAPTPVGITAAELERKTFAPIKWVVYPFIPDGLTLLAAKPKIGKSWLMLATAVAVATRGFALGDHACAQGDVLYAALEDGERRLKERLARVCKDREWPRNLTLWTEMQRLEAGGIDQLRDWIRQAKSPRLIIIDTFARVRSPKGREETPYEADYRAAGSLKALADENGVAIIVVHHVRKMEAEDPLDAVSGTTGLTGAADTILVLKREASGVTLFGRGRDIEEIELAVEFQRDICRWRVLGEAGEIRRSEERTAILTAFQEEGSPMTPVHVAAVTGKTRVSVRRLLPKMARDGELKRAEKGKYALA